MKKKHVRESLKTRIITVRTDYSNTETSPYLDWLSTKGNETQEQDAHQPSRANPLNLPESASLYYRASSVDNEKLEIIDRVAATLNAKQRQILQLVGYEGRSLGEAAAILGVSKGTVQITMNRVRAKIKKLAEDELF